MVHRVNDSSREAMFWVKTSTRHLDKPKLADI